jgi:acetolactate synthase-1/2/3 large subunit
MADAQGRLTGKPGVCIVTAGPGATNAVTGIAQAYAEASPVIQITGHSSTHEKMQPGHGVDDYEFLLKIYQPITKWSTRIKKVEDIPKILDKAFTLASSGRPGPVHIEIPYDILASRGRVESSKPCSKNESRNALACSDIAASAKSVAEILKSATYPMVALGRGVLREFCSDKVIEIAKKLGAPIITVPSATGAIPYECPLYL